MTRGPILRRPRDANRAFHQRESREHEIGAWLVEELNAIGQDKQHGTALIECVDREQRAEVRVVCGEEHRPVRDVEIARNRRLQA